MSVSNRALTYTAKFTKPLTRRRIKLCFHSTLAPIVIGSVIPMMPIMPVISVSLDKVSSCGSGTGADQRASPSAQQCPSKQSDPTANECAFRSAVMAEEGTPSCISCQSTECTKYKNNSKECSQCSLISNNPYHCTYPPCSMAHSGALVFH